MADWQSYLAQARLMLRVLELVSKQDCFVLTGGTAINLFRLGLPRLSVDIDLLYRWAGHDRPKALAAVDQALRSLAADVERKIRGAKAQIHRATEDGLVEKVFIIHQGQQVKVECNRVKRGTLELPSRQSLSPPAVELLEMEVETMVCTDPDLWGGKLTAALDRQHPRDLFDVLQLQRSGGITPAIRRGFVVHLACSPRPVHELLAGRKQALEQAFNNHFDGMTRDPIALTALEKARDQLFQTYPRSFSRQEKDFLLAIHEGELQAGPLGMPSLETLPALRWKIENIRTLIQKNPAKHAEQREALIACLSSSGA
jgi:predicted nucleotidyltransferase component of viral defense system